MSFLKHFFRTNCRYRKLLWFYVEKTWRFICNLNKRHILKNLIRLLLPYIR
ncbi:abortive infection system antitoxin AbiGi family protein [Olleya sp. Ti.3.14]|uniref:abortive infection system antitoxin AbiGi family protein n=1 Tax=Olleya sp. Ti.3.14 TaxID=3121297 RepID=UPI0040544D67